MGLLEEFATFCVHCSIGLTVLLGLTVSEFSGAITMTALPVIAVSITLSALCGSALATPDATYKKRKLCDILDFFKLWIEILELLAASATCARIASATIDYISNQRLREWVLGLQSHSLGEPWPDVLGVSFVIVVTGLFMLGLEKSSSFTLLLFVSVVFMFTFFVSVGSLHTVIDWASWREDLRSFSVHSMLSAAAVSSYGFVNTYPKMSNHKIVKVTSMVLIPLFLYSFTITIITLMSHYKELAGTATPLLRLFELRDVDWARLIMAICIICIVCLAMTEIFPTLYGLFTTLASKEWQIFLTSLQYKNSLTGAPLLAIFAAGSLAAIMAFACPLTYLVRILNSASLLKCVVQSLLLLYYFYRPEFRNDSFLVASSSSQYSKLKTTRKGVKEIPGNFGQRVVGVFSGWKKNASPSSIKQKKNKNNPKPGTTQDDEYLLLNEYCDKSIDLILNDDSSDENEEKESVLSSDVDSYTSTDVDAAVQEYKDKIEVATVNNFDKNKSPTYATAITVIIFLTVIMIATLCLSQVIVWKLYYLLWPCSFAIIFSIIVILVMPKNLLESEFALLPETITPFLAIVSMIMNITLATTMMKEIWIGFLFWSCVGCLLFWRCECCTCEGLANNQIIAKLNITENIAQYSDKYVDTILIAR